jgi:hypothetical protein
MFSFALRSFLYIILCKNPSLKSLQCLSSFWSFSALLSHKIVSFLNFSINCYFSISFCDSRSVHWSVKKKEIYIHDLVITSFQKGNKIKINKASTTGTFRSILF